MTRTSSQRAALLSALQQSHDRTLGLVDDLADSQLSVPLQENVNPFLWELGHVAFFYEAFLLQELDGGELLMGNGHELFNSFDVPHDDRWSLAFPGREETRNYMEEVLRRVQGRLADREPSARESYLYRLAIQHEDMHGEAFTYMRQTLGLPAPESVHGALQETREAGGSLPGDVILQGGSYLLGAKDDGSFVYDNEKWAHPTEIEEFAMARAPVTCKEFLAFVEDGGYERREHWTAGGWLWKQREKVTGPANWRKVSDLWVRIEFDQLVAIQAAHPVSHVSWYEADAYCKWASRRLPTEAEWELAASGTPADPNAARRFAWGADAPSKELANLAVQFGGPVDVANHPAGDSAFGCRQMIGNVWEWTASDFYPFPGYIVDHPYREYSAPWFGDRKVLRGGCWATQPSLAYNTYRNFFPPHRKDIYAGFRTCAL